MWLIIAAEYSIFVCRNVYFIVGSASAVWLLVLVFLHGWMALPIGVLSAACAAGAMALLLALFPPATPSTRGSVIGLAWMLQVGGIALLALFLLLGTLFGLAFVKLATLAISGAAACAGLYTVLCKARSRYNQTTCAELFVDSERVQLRVRNCTLLQAWAPWLINVPCSVAVVRTERGCLVQFVDAQQRVLASFDWPPPAGETAYFKHLKSGTGELWQLELMQTERLGEMSIIPKHLQVSFAMDYQKFHSLQQTLAACGVELKLIH